MRWIVHVSPLLTTDDFHRYAFAFTSALATSVAVALGLPFFHELETIASALDRRDRAQK